MIDTIDIVSLLRNEIQKKTFFKFMKQIMNYRNVYKYYLSIIKKNLIYTEHPLIIMNY